LAGIKQARWELFQEAPSEAAIRPAVVGQEEQRLRRKREQLMVLARRLAGVLQ
jgi:hypothetical protein